MSVVTCLVAWIPLVLVAERAAGQSSGLGLVQDSAAVSLKEPPSRVSAEEALILCASALRATQSRVDCLQVQLRESRVVAARLLEEMEGLARELETSERELEGRSSELWLLRAGVVLLSLVALLK